MSLASLLASFDQRVDDRNLRWSRVLVGCGALLDGLDEWVKLSYVLDPGRLSLPYVPFIPRLPADQLPILIAIWSVSAIAFIIGRYAVVPGAVLVGTMTYSLIVDQQAFSNHLYLLVLLVLLLTVAEASAERSGTGRTVAAWPILLMKLQLTIVYGYSVLFKLNPVFLSGDTIGEYIRSDGPLTVPIGLQTPEMLTAAAIVTIVVEAFLAVAFWVPALRRPALVLGLGFHAMLVWTTQTDAVIALTAFGLQMTAMYVLFVNLPERVPVPQWRPIALPRSLR